jgi:putative PIN family toxin of toxin-antitoxin system
MIVTLDTNVVLQAVASRQGASAAILDAVFARQLEMALSVPVFKEYESVLLRPQLQADLRFTVQEAQLLLQAILRVGRRQ